MSGKWTWAKGLSEAPPGLWILGSAPIRGPVPARSGSAPRRLWLAWAQKEYVAMNHSLGLRSLVSADAGPPRVRQARVLSMLHCL
ncbi:hypothetical protein GCM10007933_08250 [Zoogloea oryzae]|uniref:Uncharacterized protein n=1 Tax=Zoogloea oryzae TaxID=310767 RepID=A0ABQ6F736_9RHOO|nr:hypothetical protein GCM10007933_08250 [Zoogloea oryzae]